ncbi:MAG: hypothetical protein AABY01_02840 [Nanoarchaeota archaeon]
MKLDSHVIFGYLATHPQYMGSSQNLSRTMQLRNLAEAGKKLGFLEDLPRVQAPPGRELFDAWCAQTLSDILSQAAEEPGRKMTRAEAESALGAGVTAKYVGVLFDRKGDVKAAQRQSVIAVRGMHETQSAAQRKSYRVIGLYR